MLKFNASVSLAKSWKASAYGNTMAYEGNDQMEKLIDLHTHSVYSDGTMTPSELVCHAKKEGISAISLTDHDSVDGVCEALEKGREIGIEVVPGIEFSVQSETETHILGYYIDVESQALKNVLPKILNTRRERGLETAEKLKKQGIDVSYEDALSLAPGGLVGRAHFARIMTERGYTKSVKEAFERYLSSGKKGYSSRQYLTDEEAIRIIKESGGVSFVAHLHLIRLPDDELYEYLKKLKSAGLDGIEGYYTEYTGQMQSTYQKMASSLSLAISGGTDFHAESKPHISIGRGLGEMKIPYDILTGIKTLVK